jgi:hypothetical protein
VNILAIKLYTSPLAHLKESNGCYALPLGYLFSTAVNIYLNKIYLVINLGTTLVAYLINLMAIMLYLGYLFSKSCKNEKRT